jgi:flavin reductase (DIM6/NTAB) family NADH-FMN oxidoreductase RutF
MHRVVEPAILYFGTPVVLVSTLNEDGSPNLAPMSSAWWLGWSCLLGFGARSKTPQNLLRTGECVLNLPSVDQVAFVDRLARTTGSNPVPEHKVRMGYRHVKDKFECAGLTPVPSTLVAPPRVAQCPVQLEAVLTARHGLQDGAPALRGRLVALEVQVRRVHLDERLLVEGTADRVDPDRWRPLIMSFGEFYGLGASVHPSALAQIPQGLYRPPVPQVTS